MKQKQAIPTASLWMRCAAAGFLISYIVATGHWLLVEQGIVARFRDLSVVDEDMSGVSLVEAIHRASTGLPPRLSDPPGNKYVYSAIAYGWPIANWGTVFRDRGAFYWQNGIEPVWAVDLRPVWPGGTLPDPYKPEITREKIAAQIAAGSIPPGTLCFDAYERYLPAFPLLGHSLLASLVYGIPIYAWLKWRAVRRRRGCCPSCGYDLRGIGVVRACPECGVERNRGAG